MNITKYRRSLAAGALVGAGFNFGGSMWSFASQPVMTMVCLTVGVAALLFGVALLFTEEVA